MDGTAINSYRVAVGAQASVFPELERLISTPAFVNSTQPALAGCQATDASSSSASASASTSSSSSSYSRSSATRTTSSTSTAAGAGTAGSHQGGVDARLSKQSRAARFFQVCVCVCVCVCLYVCVPPRLSHLPSPISNLPSHWL